MGAEIRLEKQIAGKRAKRRAIDLLIQKKFEDALIEAKQAHRLINDPGSLMLLSDVWFKIDPIRSLGLYEKIITLSQIELSQSPSQKDVKQLKARVERAQTHLNEHKARAGKLRIEGLKGAKLFIAGKERGQLPLQRSIYLLPGSYRVECSLEGYLSGAPHIVEVRAGQGQRVDVSGTLTKKLPGMGSVLVKSKLLGVTILVDGQESPASFQREVGDYQIRVEREGFVPYQEKISIVGGRDLKVKAQLRLLEEQPKGRSAHIRILVNRAGATLRLNGETNHRLSGMGQRLPLGEHKLEVRAKGFEPWHRTLKVSGKDEIISVKLWPLPETQRALLEEIKEQDFWGWISGGSGTLLVIAGIVTYFVAQSISDSADEDRSDLCQEALLSSSCDLNSITTDAPPNAPNRGGLKERRDVILSDIDSADTMEKSAYAILGLGTAAAVTGAILLLSNDDPNLYRREHLTPVLQLSSETGGAFVGIRGSF